MNRASESASPPRLVAPAALPEGLVLRPARDDEREFLYRVYAGTRREEIGPTGWSEAEKEAFLRFQFEAQDSHYREHFPAAEFLVVVDGGEPIGRLYVDRRPDEIRLIDIALLPEQRGRGIGGALMALILDQAGRTGRAVRIHVETSNPAQRLYKRLGFRPVELQGLYELMEWLPDQASSGVARE